MIFNKSTDRREFIKDATRTGLVIGMAGTLGGTLLSACGDAKDKRITTSLKQSDLPYDFNALEPHIDALTMEIHYGKHAAAYANNTIAAAEEENVSSDVCLEDILPNISQYSTKMRNNAGGHYNHELFWKIMKPGGSGDVSGNAAELINRDFGSFQDFVTAFNAAGGSRFGSGWAWLIYKDDKLMVTSTPNQDNPLMDVADVQGFPLIGLDVWEHAYYLKYQNRRAEYMENWWNLVNWEEVNKRLASIMM
jgi:superoxide dismutase, Fe-Mn family